jgi:hypothetical protein
MKTAPTTNHQPPTTNQMHRIFNFSAGPAVLPVPVLEQAQRELIALPGVGMSVMEISHRSKTFEGLLDHAIADIRELAGLDDSSPTRATWLLPESGRPDHAPPPRAAPCS